MPPLALVTRRFSQHRPTRPAAVQQPQPLHRCSGRDPRPAVRLKMIPLAIRIRIVKGNHATRPDELLCREEILSHARQPMAGIDENEICRLPAELEKNLSSSQNQLDDRFSKSYARQRSRAFPVPP